MDLYIKNNRGNKLLNRWQTMQETADFFDLDIKESDKPNEVCIAAGMLEELITEKPGQPITEEDLCDYDQGDIDILMPYLKNVSSPA